MQDHICNGPTCNGKHRSELEFDRDEQTGKRLIYCRRCVRALQESSPSPQKSPAQKAPAKTCKSCHKPKPLTEFSRFHNSRDGHLHTCKTCIRKKRKAAAVRATPASPSPSSPSPSSPSASSPTPRKAPKKKAPASKHRTSKPLVCKAEDLAATPSHVPAIELRISGITNLLALARGNPEALQDLARRTQSAAAARLKTYANSILSQIAANDPQETKTP